jgi:hypothetical protein
MRENAEASLIAFAHYFVRQLSKIAQRLGSGSGRFLILEAFSAFNKRSAVTALVDSATPCAYDAFF